jgi:hypothetical protein
VFPDLAFDAARFSMFQWLVVEEELPLDPRPAARAWPLFFELMIDHDFGHIEPHKGASRLLWKKPFSPYFSPRGKNGHRCEGWAGGGSAPHGRIRWSMTYSSRLNILAQLIR